MNDVGKDEGFKYYAFISYSHADERWAKSIQDSLEGYKLPSAIRSEAGRELPARVRPVFRDATDLGAGVLKESLKKELAASKYLIVVCSPNSARENAEGKCWVEEEVRHFARNLNRPDRVIPVIVAGTPKDSFCPTLKELDCLALDAGKHPRPRIVNDIVAKILGLSPDELWRREERRRRRRRTAAALLSVFLLAIGLAVCWYQWDSTRTVTCYYATSNVLFGVDHGVQELDPNAADLPERYYRFDYQGYLRGTFGWRRKLQQVRCVGREGVQLYIPHVDWRGGSSSTATNAVMHAYEYREGGEVASITRIDGNGKIVEKCLFARNVPNRMEVVEYGPNNERVGRDSERTFQVFDGNGELERIVVSEHGGAYVHFFYDDKGRMIRRENYDRGGNLNSFVGFAIDTMEYDEQGHVVSRLFYDVNTNLVVLSSNKGTAGYTNVFNVAGDMIRTVFIGADGNPMENSYGYARVDREFTENHLEKRELFFDVGGWPVREKKADGVAGYEYQYDEHGRKIRGSYLDEKHQPTLQNGIAYVRFSENAGMQRRLFYGTNDLPVVSNKGCAGIDVKLDSRGNMLQMTTLGLDGRPCLNKNGWATRLTEYDNQGWVISEEFLDVDGHNVSFPVDPELDRYFKTGKMTISYDRMDGQVKAIALKTCTATNAAYLVLRQMPAGGTSEMEFLDQNRQLTPGPLGWARKCYYNFPNA